MGKSKKKEYKKEIKIKAETQNTIAISDNGIFAGVELRAAEGGQSEGYAGKNANQGGLIAGDNGKNANQFSEVSSDDEPGAPGALEIEEAPEIEEASELEEAPEIETITEAAQSTKLWKRWFDK